MNDIISILPLIVLFAIFVFLVIKKGFNKLAALIFLPVSIVMAAVMFFKMGGSPSVLVKASLLFFFLGYDIFATTFKKML